MYFYKNNYKRSDSLLTSRGLSQLRNSRLHKSLNICLVSASDVMEHFAFPGNIDFAADYQGPWNRVYHRRITNNFPCNRHISTTSGSKSSPRKIFYRNSSGARTLTSNSAWTTKEKTSTRNRGAEGTSLSTAKATPTTRDRGIGDWNHRHYDRFTLSKTQIS